MDDLDTTRERLFRQLDAAVATDAIGALPFITALQKETDEHLREAVRQASAGSSWRDIAAALGVSKQAAHQRFKVYAKEMADGMRTEHRAMKQARRSGDAGGAAAARARRDALAARLRTAAGELKDQA